MTVQQAQRTLPGPPRTAALRMLMVMGRDRLGMMTSAAARYGDAALLPVGPKELYFFNHPEHAKYVLADHSANYHKGIGLVHARRALGDGLLTSEGELWRKQRKVIQAVFQLASLGAVPAWIPLPRQLRFRRARRDLQRIVDQLVARRHDEGGDGVDVLSRLIVSAGAETDPRVGQQRLRDELVTLLLAGHETTASTLGWMLHLLDEHPEVRSRLRDEVVDVLGDRLPAQEDVHRLRYTTMVVEEAMRLYPPVWLLPRKALAADVVGGYRVPAGADVLICPYTLHRHPAFWPAPERFD